MGEDPFHSNNVLFLGETLLHEVFGQHFSRKKNRNSEKIDSFLTPIHGWVQEENVFSQKFFLRQKRA
jgi:hypothetical protein